ncbi:sigma factor-like helix-turn-helix DNA-binding protein [Mycobacterium gastri]|uniref:RNA polymerase sigma factor 70 region 4 type 2 domain-containing protein n=1 Tax=Mycobacterium gastri TaxID=1777 RepID=A0A1X1VYP1_MYCGS|nr:sigma factor-like helix-turn-helix DNA-binding protein [Mycobacterium gastri]ETW24278.1 hypothetical protein MGAST_09335 [Mycobacterium gastri 'Wayne']ORV75442.1 hypothetical protein AWC07_23555 [Mycobacterium gastri]
MLFTIAYEILGSATESADVLQDGYVRFAAVDLETVRDTKSYLAQLVTRAVFVLREVFGFDYAEIADAFGKSAPAVPQIAHRSREHVRARRKRYGARPIDPQRHAQITAQFLDTAASGDKITNFYVMRNPEKLTALASPGEISRG